MPEPALTVLFSQRNGALDRIISLLRRRGFPIDGVTVERTHRADIGRMTIVVAPEAAEQVSRHLRRLPDVLEVNQAGETDAVQREFALIRIRCAPAQRPEIMALLAAFDARAISVTADHMVIEAAGRGTTLDALCSELARYGIDEAARTNPIALHRISPVSA
jgi:acetolactate synthase-1/3 small subunit